MAAGLDSVNRGKTVGTIFTGILIGILAARVFSGAIAEWLSWRWVYGFSAGLVLAVTLLLKAYLPEVETSFKGSYLKLLGSTLSMATVLEGNVDAILLTGGIAYCKSIVEYITRMVAFMAPVEVFPGEDEMEALAMNGLAVLRGAPVKVYT